jgi:hypothetical protein
MGFLIEMSALQRRRFLEKTYNHLYKRVEGFDLTQCAYCNGPRHVLDHVPALTYTDGMNIKKYLKKGGKFLYYPSCNQCNKFLGCCKEIGFYDRLQVLAAKYDKKLSKIEVWSDEELSEMGYGIRAYIEGRQSTMSFYQDKLSVVEEKITKIQLGELTEEGIELLQ